jgi:hypothetical protein
MTLIASMICPGCTEIFVMTNDQRDSDFVNGWLNQACGRSEAPW